MTKKRTVRDVILDAMDRQRELKWTHVNMEKLLKKVHDERAAADAAKAKGGK